MRKILIIIFGVFLLNLASLGSVNAQQFVEIGFICSCTSYDEDIGECVGAAIKDDSGCKEAGYIGTVTSCLRSPQRVFDGDFEAFCVEDDVKSGGYGDFCDLNSDNPCEEGGNFECAFDIDSNLSRCIRPNSVVNGGACINSSECIGGGCAPNKDGSRVCEGGSKVPTCEGKYGIGFPSALGCFPFDSVQAAAASNVFLLGISGAIALLMIARAAFIYMTSQGDPAKIMEVRESITAVVFGILMLAFAVFILRFFGDTLLGLID